MSHGQSWERRSCATRVESDRLLSRQMPSALQQRLGKYLQISTGPAEKAPQEELRSPGSRSIQLVQDFSTKYELLGQVMPSTHKNMSVRFAKRKRDGHDCVVKLRFKPGCFHSRSEEKAWRTSMAFLLNMPDNSGIAQVYEVLEDSAAFYVVMEKISGSDLFEALEGGHVSVDVAREILRQLLEAISHLHGQNQVHKDLKLENVMIDQTFFTPKTSKTPTPFTPNSVKVIDFDTLEKWCPKSPKSKDVVGTDQYIAQEAYDGKYSPASDIFALGVIAYRLLSGKFPFDGDMFDDEAGDNWVGSPKMMQIRQKLKIAKIDFSRPVWVQNKDAAQLVSSMMAYEESARPTTEDALNHRFFGSSRRDERKPSLPAGGWSSPALSTAISQGEIEGVSSPKSDAKRHGYKKSQSDVVQPTSAKKPALLKSKSDAGPAALGSERSGKPPTPKLRASLESEGGSPKKRVNLAPPTLTRNRDIEGCASPVTPASSTSSRARRTFGLDPVQENLISEDFGKTQDGQAVENTDQNTACASPKKTSQKNSRGQKEPEGANQGEPSILGGRSDTGPAVRAVADAPPKLTSNTGMRRVQSDLTSVVKKHMEQTKDIFDDIDAGLTIPDEAVICSDRRKALLRSDLLPLYGHDVELDGLWARQQSSTAR